MHTYSDAQRYLSQGKDPNRRRAPRGTATYIVRVADDAIAVRYHETDVLTWKADGSIVLNSGGWRTSTTKARINEYLPGPWLLWQERGVWYIGKGPHFEDTCQPYADCCTLLPDGTTDLPTVDLKAIADTQRAIRRYVKGYVKALAAGQVSASATGDCWYCLMRTEDGKTLGEASGDTSHLESHFTERYYVSSLVRRAIEVFPVSEIAGGWLYEAFYGEASKYTVFQVIAQDQIAKSLTRYLKRCFGIAS